MSITLEAAKAEARKTRQANADDYGIEQETNSRTTHSPTVPSSPPVPDEFEGEPVDAEPADPNRLSHRHRRNTRIAPPTFDCDDLPKPLVECGCGDCSDGADPLADEDNVFRDLAYAQETCPSPRPMTVRRAAEAYLRYQFAAEDRDGWTSKLEETRNQQGRYLGAEREILSEMENPTQLFLSLRLSPIERHNGSRQWVHPLRLDARLADSWENVRPVINYHLRDYESHYATVIAGTTSAATPHRHVAVYVEDPDDEVGTDVAEAAVDSHVRNTVGATPEDHSVEPGARDAGIVFHDPPLADGVPEESLRRVLDYRDGEAFSVPTVPLYYALNQRPHWVLKNVRDGTNDIHVDDPLVDAGAIAWASTHRWLSPSAGFPITD